MQSIVRVPSITYKPIVSYVELINFAKVGTMRWATFEWRTSLSSLRVSQCVYVINGASFDVSFLYVSLAVDWANLWILS